MFEDIRTHTSEAPFQLLFVINVKRDLAEIPIRSANNLWYILYLHVLYIFWIHRRGKIEPSIKQIRPEIYTAGPNLLYNSSILFSLKSCIKWLMVVFEKRLQTKPTEYIYVRGALNPSCFFVSSRWTTQGYLKHFHRVKGHDINTIRVSSSLLTSSTTIRF